MVTLVRVAVAALALATLPSEALPGPEPAGAPNLRPGSRETAAPSAEIATPRQPADAAGAPVTEGDLLAAVGPDHPALAALRERVAVSESRVLAAATLETPELSLMREDPSGRSAAPGVEQLDLTVSWQLPRRSRATAIDAARAGVAAARAEAEDLGARLQRELRAVFARWAVATESARVLGEHAERLRELALRERRRAASGEVAGLAARRLELAAAEAAARRSLAGAESESARRLVAGWSPEVATGRPVLPALPDPPVSGMPGPHPSLAALEQELESARLEREAAARFDLLPELIAGWQRQDDGVSELDGPLLGISWRVPLFDPNRAARAEAEARIAGGEARLERQTRALEAEREAAAAALRTLLEAAREADVAADAVAPLVEGAVAAFRLGESELTELLDVLRSAADAGLRALELRAAALEAERDLAYLLTASSTP